MTATHTEAVNAGPGLEFCPLMGNYGAPTITLDDWFGMERDERGGVAH